MGDTVHLLRTVDDNWVFGRNERTHCEGIVPLAFLQVKIPLSDVPVALTHKSRGNAECVFCSKHILL